jgi:peroxiredoxin
MKKILVIVAAALALVSCGDGKAKTYVVEGSIEGALGKIALVDMNDKNIFAEVKSEDGTFTLEVESKHPLMAVLKVHGDQVLPVFLDASPLKIEGSMNEIEKISVSGSASNEAFKKYNRKQYEILAPMQDSEDLSYEQINEALMKLQEIANVSYEENKDNLWGAYLLVSMKSALLSATEIIEAVEALPKDIQKEESIVALKESAKAQLKSEIGKPYTDIELPNAEDKLVALSEVVKANKVVLLDFWASWCGPCMREVPHLMKAYGDFHEKGFEIYGVSLDGDKESWMNAVQSNNFMWVNVLSLPDSEAKAPEKYGVSTIPSNFLIDSATGKIIAKNLRGEALEEELSKFFAE